MMLLHIEFSLPDCGDRLCGSQGFIWYTCLRLNFSWAHALKIQRILSIDFRLSLAVIADSAANGGSEKYIYVVAAEMTKPIADCCTSASEGQKMVKDSYQMLR